MELTLLLDSASPVEAAAKAGMGYLHQCYMARSNSSTVAADALKEREFHTFALQYVALEQADADPRVWRIKPKLHICFWSCVQKAADKHSSGPIEMRSMVVARRAVVNQGLFQQSAREVQDCPPHDQTAPFTFVCT